ncbi:MAG: hypothetical protein LBR08_10880 [Bacteroidales bacterium]|nr:hypothetical protein [Bacteroidales bacterium]
MRKFFITVLLVLSFAAAGVSVYFVLSNEKEHVADTLYEAIPPDAGLIIEIRDYATFCGLLSENPLWGQLCKIPSLRLLNEDILQLNRLGQANERVLPLHRHLIFSVHPAGREEMYSIGFLKVDNEKEVEIMTDEFKRKSADAAVFSNRTYDQATITDVVFKQGDKKAQTLSYAYRRGILIFSRSSILLENALRHLVAGPPVTRQGTLAALVRTAGKNAPANIYINYAQLPREAATVVHPTHHKLMQPLVRFADWTVLDLNLKPDLLIFNGFTAYDPLQEHWSAVLQGQQAIPVTLTDAMPPSTYAYLWWGIPHIRQYFTDYGQYLEKNRETAYKKELSRISASFRIDLQADFAEQFENEAALVYAHLGQLSSEETPFALFRIKSTSSAVAMIEDWQETVCNRTGSATAQHRETLQFDHQLSFTAYRFPFDIPAALFGDLFSGSNTWCTAVDDYLLFGSSTDQLKRYLHYTALHASLQTDLSFGRLANDFSSRCNVMFYCNPAVSGGFFKQLFKPERFKELEPSGEILAPIGAAVYQLGVSGEMCYNNIFLKYLSNESAERSTAMQTSWESLLDTAIAFKPQLVQNHNTGEMEVFVQDMANNVYLLNNIGRILWKVPLPEPVVSPVYQVDLYRNKKLQMLFNTRNYIYVLDRLGNTVENFPVKLKSPATGGIALFDYDNDRNYRIMVACEDRKVYAYEKNGKPLTGWQFLKSEHPVQTDLYHYRSGNRDFIVFADKYKVYILDRQGKTRVSPEYNFPVGRNTTIAAEPPFSDAPSHIVLTDTAGAPHFISLIDGKIRKQEIKTFPPSHFFVFQDVNGDRQGDFIFAGNRKVEVFRQDGTQLMSIDTEEPVVMRPYVYEFAAGDLKIGIVAPQKNLIYLYDRQGKLHEGFPLRGSTLFSIGRLDKLSRNFNLFVGSKNNFLYNYPVHH